MFNGRSCTCPTDHLLKENNNCSNSDVMYGWTTAFGCKLLTAWTASKPPMKTTTQNTFVCLMVRLHSPRTIVMISLMNEL